MTKDILITITGRQSGVEEEPVTIALPGTYHFANGKHFIQYDETDESGMIIRNTIKMSNSEVTYSKKDAYNTRMYFELKEKTQMNYQTPYGNLVFDVFTNRIITLESADRIEVRLEYTLSNQGSSVSDNILQIILKADTSK